MFDKKRFVVMLTNIMQHEMRQARLQHNELQNTEQFFEGLLSNEDFKEKEKAEDTKSSPLSSNQSFKVDAVAARFSDPPAPPPQQPLPEKPAAPRIQTGEGSLRRSNTERPRSQTTSPVKPGNESQIVSLLEALKTAKKEIESQGDRVRQLEMQLHQEREARMSAEEVAKRLGDELNVPMANGAPKESKVDEESFKLQADIAAHSSETLTGDKGVDAALQNTEEVESTAKLLRSQMEVILAEMQEMKQKMESYRQRAELAEQERDAANMTLAEMVRKIRGEEEVKKTAAAFLERRASIDSMKSAKSARASSNSSEGTVGKDTDSEGGAEETGASKLENGAATAGQAAKVKQLEQQLAVALQNPVRSQMVNQTAPYASMLGVVLLGMGLMAYMNGWQKVDRS